MDIQNMLGAALRQHQAGQLEQAAQLYRTVLNADPGNARALYLLGMLLLGQGHAVAAADLTRKALAIDSRDAGYHFQLGAALQTLGDMEGALISYRRALVLQPNNPDTYNNMGNALAAQGSLDQAMDCLRRALALQPQNAVSHCSLGVVQWRLSLRDEAEASFRQAIALQPDYAAAIINLGGMLRDQGALAEAENYYRRAVALAPQSAAAHGALGLLLWNLGRRDEAMASYRHALQLDPGNVETLANLGLARWDLGALEEAEAMLARAHALRPGDTGILNNLAALLIARGNFAAAMEMIQRSLTAQETGRAKRLFASLARQSRWDGAGEEIRAVMVRALTEPWDQPGRLARAAADMIKFNPAIGPWVSRAHAAWPKRLAAPDLLGATGFEPLADDALLLALLTSAPNTDIALEHFLTMARAALLAARNASADDKTLRFAAALAQQCFINEYIFLPDDAEAAQALQARTDLITALEKGDPIAPLHLLAVAAYFPLIEIPGAAKLLELPWPAPLETVLTQQIREPAQEQQLAASIPRLTPVEDTVSRLVQSQYEENPYPRWVRLPPETPDNILSFLSAKFPAADFERHPARPLRDYLVAGCGTGQQSITTAQKFGDGNLLAMDLSLASLCYARRKSDQLGLKIEYGQGDILALGSLGRQFDVIECSGVLHHMADPFAGWQSLVTLLRPNGFMKLGFYSEAARRPIARERARIAQQGITDIRKYRQDLMLSDDPSIQTAILNSEDFFTTSACRDLMFHVQEHHMTLPKISAFLQRHGLRFLGFELDDAVLDAYRQRFADDVAATDLANWAKFESEHPGMFARMYEFWVWKAS